MKISFFLFLVITAFLLTSCNKSSKTTDTSIQNYAPVLDTSLDALDYVQLFKDAGLPIDNLIIVTSKDKNKSISSKESSFQSKVTFVDSRSQSFKENRYNDCFLEVYSEEESAILRKKLLETLSEFSMGQVLQVGSLILYLPSELTDNQVQQYKKIFYSFPYVLKNVTDAPPKETAILPSKKSTTASTESKTYVVGTDLAPGEYVLLKELDNSYFILKSAADNAGTDTKQHISTNRIVSVKKGDYLTVKGVYMKSIADSPILDISKQGMFKIGLHLNEGNYKIVVNSDSIVDFGIIELTKDASYQSSSIISTHVFSGTTTIHVANGEYLYVQGAHIETE
ncbi:MAG: hypothetical protein Q4F05_15270 [bacterium]|nr:hypothetical protein [bacterium]